MGVLCKIQVQTWDEFANAISIFDNMVRNLFRNLFGNPHGELWGRQPAWRVVGQATRMESCGWDNPHGELCVTQPAWRVVGETTRMESCGWDTCQSVWLVWVLPLTLITEPCYVRKFQWHKFLFSDNWLPSRESALLNSWFSCGCRFKKGDFHRYVVRYIFM